MDRGKSQGQVISDVLLIMSPSAERMCELTMRGAIEYIRCHVQIYYLVYDTNNFLPHIKVRNNVKAFIVPWL